MWGFFLCLVVNFWVFPLSEKLRCFPLSDGELSGVCFCPVVNCLGLLLSGGELSRVLLYPVVNCLGFFFVRW